LDLCNVKGIEEVDYEAFGKNSSFQVEIFLFKNVIIIL